MASRPGQPESTNPHDALFRQTFGTVEHAAAELRAVLPAELLSLLSLNTLHLAPGSFVDAMQALARAENGREALMTLFRYLSLVVEDLTTQTLVLALAPAALDRKEPLVTTLAERWMEEGRIKASRQILLKQLKLKFGELQGAERTRVENASEEELLRFIDRVLDADSLAAVLAD